MQTRSPHVLLPQETVSQCHSEPQAKNLVFVSCSFDEMLHFVQHDIHQFLAVTTQPLTAEEHFAARLRPLDSTVHFSSHSFPIARKIFSGEMGSDLTRTPSAS